jgi:hypothetical protein
MALQNLSVARGSAHSTVTFAFSLLSTVFIRTNSNISAVYAARGVLIIFEILRSDVLRAMSERMNTTKETVGCQRPFWRRLIEVVIRGS